MLLPIPLSCTSCCASLALGARTHLEYPTESSVFIAMRCLYVRVEGIIEGACVYPIFGRTVWREQQGATRSPDVKTC